MGQALKKLTPSGSEQNEGKEKIRRAIEESYRLYFKEAPTPPTNFSEFYHAVCKTVEKINEVLEHTQISFPKKETLEGAYNRHVFMKERPPSQGEFQKILEEVMKETTFTGIGVKDTLLYIFGVPATTVFIKNRVMPDALPNEVFIPAITSLTVLALAKFNKI